MVDVVTSIEIKAPLTKVAAYAMDPDKAPEWYVNIKSVEWKTSKPLTIGSQVVFVAHFMGRELNYTYEIIVLSVDRLVMRTSDGPFPMETSYSFAELSDDLTRMTLRNRGRPSGFSGLFAPFMSTMMKMANKKDLRRIKKILERGE